MTVPGRHEHERGAPLTSDCDNWCRSKHDAFTRSLEQTLRETTPGLPPPAQEAAFYCNKCGYFGPGGPSHKRGGNEPCNYLAAQIGPHWTRDQLLAAIAPYKADAERYRMWATEESIAALMARAERAEKAEAALAAERERHASQVDDVLNGIAILIEREACANVVETCEWPRWAEASDSREVFAAAIRARGVTPAAEPDQQGEA